MAALLRCLLRSCFGDGPDDREENIRHNDHRGPIANASAGSVSRASRSGYQATRQTDPGDDSDENEDCCQQGGTSRSSSASSADVDGTAPNLVQEFWSRLRDRLAKFELDHNNSEDGLGRRGEGASILGRSSTNRAHGIFRRNSSDTKSKKRKSKTSNSSVPLLRAASTFDESKEIPSICADEIVLPGSKLQAQMAAAAQKSLDEMGDECVICMDTFDATNPRMPTLCGCGENKTYFHLPCLYQWIEQNKNCPSCRKRLRWEEL